MASVRDFGAKGDGKTDDTLALMHAVEKGDGHVVLPRGEYLITRPVVVPLEKVGRTAISGEGGTAKVIMAGAGPAFHLVGTHQRNAAPGNVEPGVWQRERMPTLRELEIEGRHPKADGVRLEGVMQPTLQGLLIRRCRHGIHLVKRDRNVLIADCHVYDCSGVGIFLDGVNLHQTVIHGNHVSYCKQGGIRVAGSEVRNIQICGNDIEYNYDPQAETSADVLFDCREGTVREGTIVGNTIQARESPNGANVRLQGVGRESPNAVGLLAITGNLLGSEETVLHLQSCRGVVVSGNSIYSGYKRSVWVEDSDQIVIGANSIDHNPEYRGDSTDALVVERSRNVTLSGLVVQHTKPATVPVEATLDVRDCENVQVVGCQIVNARVRGVRLTGSRVVRVADCTIRGRPGDDAYLRPVEVAEGCRLVLVTGNFLGKGKGGPLRLPPGAGEESGNVTVE